jgi:hypothetical protein
MALTRDEIYQKLKAANAEQPEKVLKEVSYNLALAGVTASTLEERAAMALQRIKSEHGSNALSHEAKKNEKTSLSKCPICRFDMKTVKLLEDRNAFYCPDHRIVVPFPSVSDEEADV